MNETPTNLTKHADKTFQPVSILCVL